MIDVNIGEKNICKYPQESSQQRTESAFCTDQVQKFTLWKTACFSNRKKKNLDLILKAFAYSYYARVLFQTPQLKCLKLYCLKGKEVNHL